MLTCTICSKDDLGFLFPSLRNKTGDVLSRWQWRATQPFAFMPEWTELAKAALVNLTVSLSKELANTGITVNTMSPGIIVTPGREIVK